jgi:hypothetical protein
MKLDEKFDYTHCRSNNVMSCLYYYEKICPHTCTYAQDRDRRLQVQSTVERLRKQYERR